MKNCKRKQDGFYKLKEWKKIREYVLEKLDRNECQRCKEKKKKIKRATVVHHVWELEDYPEYGLDIYVNGKRNLVSLCRECHEEIHGRGKKKPLTEEKW